MGSFLKVDKQTISDLVIFGSPGKASVYDLYNMTRTQGGSAKLKELFQHPLADDKLINEKAEIFRFFSTKDFSFPIDSEIIGGLAFYLENEDLRSQLQTEAQSLGQKVKNMVAADYARVFVHDGVQNGLRLFYKLSQFVKQMEESVAGSAYEPVFNKLVQVVNDSAFSLVRQHFGPGYEAKLNMIVLAELDRLIRFKHREKLLDLLDLVYDLDVFISVGQTARKRKFHFAKAMPKDSGALNYKQVYHPLLESAIANDLSLNKEHNILFLTGANMAGKSTLMKSIGIALYLGHMGFPIAAEKFDFAVRDGIFTSINLSDNLSTGASHYYSEVLRVKEVARELSEGRQLFVIFDEMFRGTNVKDAYDATLLLTRAFCKKQGSQFIISTHIMEAGELLQKEQLPVNYRFLPTEMKDGKPVYTRILKEGITADRQGMIIIQNEGIPDMLDAGLKGEEEFL